VAANVRRSLAILVTLASFGSAIESYGRAAEPGDAASGTRLPSPTASASSCSTTGVPVPRSSMVFVYMTNLGEALLFGGRDSAGRALADTWTWTGGCWSQHDPVLAPEPRDHASALYDPDRHAVLLYGGRGGGQFYSDTWSWNGQNWAQLAKTGPPFLFGGQVAGFDPIGRKPLLFGMANNNTSQTWAWSGSNWSQLSPVHSPDGRESASLALDASRNALLLFGGVSLSRGPLNDTWGWNGSDWTQYFPASSPQARFRASMASWSARHLVILWGGVEQGPTGDAWAWDGATWREIVSPGVRSDGGAADSGSAVLFFGGENSTGPYNDLQTFDGTRWTTAT
jgi:hypothetical protein